MTDVKRTLEREVKLAADDGFTGTPLADLLTERGIDRLVITGIQSEMCVAAMARGALARGLAVLLPRGGHTTYDVPSTPHDPGVPAELVSRVAVWALGDTVEVTGLEEVRW